MSIQLDFLYDGLQGTTGYEGVFDDSDSHAARSSSSALFEDNVFVLPRVNDVSFVLTIIQVEAKLCAMLTRTRKNILHLRSRPNTAVRLYLGDTMTKENSSR